MALLTIPDNLTAGVRHACYYDPDVNPTYHHMSVHYNTAVLPARPRKPRDKSKAEAGVPEPWHSAGGPSTLRCTGELRSAELRKTLDEARVELKAVRLT